LAIARRWRLLEMSLLLVAVLLRLLAAVLVDRHVQQAGRLFLIEGDANGYWELGRRIASGQDYSIYTPPRRILRVPGFPLLLAGCIRLFGDSVLPARIVLAFVGTACCALTYLLGRMLFMRRVGFWACLFVAVNPLQVGNSVLILSETWFTFWMLLTLLLMAYVFQAKAAACDTSQKEAGLCGWRLGLVTCGLGACIGITTLIRPGFLPWVIITVGGLLVLLKRSAGIRLYVSVTTVAGCLLVMSPWAVRNLEVSGHLVWTSLWSGPSLYDGLNPQATGASDMRFFDEERLLSRMSEFEMNQQYKDRAVEFARQNPGRAVELGVAKAVDF
jgi:4-amino-4-deoxy-L-arabinose transferase-like glycosyltransferase